MGQVGSAGENQASSIVFFLKLNGSCCERLYSTEKRKLIAVENWGIVSIFGPDYFGHIGICSHHSFNIIVRGKALRIVECFSNVEKTREPRLNYLEALLQTYYTCCLL